MAINRTSPKKGKVVDIPTTPTIGTATAGAQSATVAFTAATIGGPTTTFTALSSPGSITGSGLSSPITVTGLTAGTAYTFTVRGNNATGSSEYSSASNSVTPTVATAYESIATQTVGAGGATSITFSSIPSTYKHLQLRITGRDQLTGNYDDILTRLNGDSGTNYTYHQIKGNGTAASAYPSASGSWTGSPLFPLNSANAASNNTITTAIIDILDYTSTNKNKTMRCLFGWDGNGAGDIGLRSGLWLNTAAVTSITLVNYGTPYFGQYSSIALYGTKG